MNNSVNFKKKVYEIHISEFAPGYWYEGVYTPPRLLTYFSQGVAVFDAQSDGDLDLIVPLNKGYRSGSDTREKFLVFTTSDGFLEFDQEATNTMPFTSGSRQTDFIYLKQLGEFAVVTTAHDTTVEGESDASIPWRMGDLTITGMLSFNDYTGLVIGDEILPTSYVGRSTAVNAHAMAVGDVNGDGLDDIVVADYAGGFSLIQQETGHFLLQLNEFLTSLTWNYDLPNTPTTEQALLLDLHLVDLNGDGYDDLVAGWGHGGNKTTIFFNDGSGDYSLSNAVFLDKGIYGVANDMHMKTFSEDFDLDGDEDLVILHTRFDPYYGGNYLQFVTNLGDRSFIDETTSWFGAVPNSPETFMERLRWTDFWQVLDINGDGYLDIVGHSPEWENDRELILFVNNNGESFDSIRLPFDGGRPIAWADFDADGNVEFLAANNKWISDGLNVFEFNLYDLSSGVFV